MTVANQTAVDEILTLSPLKQNALFALTATRNGDVYPLRFQIAAPQKRSVGEATAIDDLAAPLNLRSKERLDWRVSIEGGLPAGVYQVTVVANGRDSYKRRLIWQDDSVEFEVREQSADAGPEILFRRALRHYLSKDPEGLRRAANDADALLKIHPK